MSDPTGSTDGEVLAFRVEALEKALESKAQWCNTMSLDFEAKLRTWKQTLATREEQIRDLHDANADLMDRINRISEGDYWATRTGELASEVAELKGRLRRIEDAVAGRDPYDDEFDDD